jgi:putative DNA primase/helicase
MLPAHVLALLPRFAVLLVDRRKRPMTAHGWEDATHDAEELATLYERALADPRLQLDPNDPDPAARDRARVAPVQFAIQPRASGFVVLDVDPRNFEPGTDPLVELRRADPDVLDTYHVETPQHGTHYYYAAPDPFVRVPSCVLRPGLELKGDTGYLLVPPDLGPSDEHPPYRRADRSPDHVRPYPEAVEHLVETRRSSPTGSSLGYTVDLGEIVEGTGRVPLGQRDHVFYALACRLRGANAPLEEAARTLQRIWEVQTDQPDDDVYPAEAVLRKLRRVYDTFEPDVTPDLLGSAASLVTSAASQLTPVRAPAQPVHTLTPADEQTEVEVEGVEVDPDTGEELPEPDLHSLHPYTDVGFVERFLDRHGDVIRYNAAAPSAAGWFAYQPQHGTWSTDRAAGLVQQLIADTAVDVWRTEADVVAEADRPALRRFCERFQNGSGVETAFRFLSRNSRVVLNETDLDARTSLLCVSNGVVDIDTLVSPDPDPITFAPRHVLLPHDPTYLCRRRLELDYASDEECPAWNAFLETTLPDPELRRFVQTMVGYALSGRGTEKSLFLILGPTNTGKSVFVSALRAVFDEYTTVLSPEAVLDRKNEDPDNRDLVSLPGKRFAFVPEVPAGRRLQAARLKTLASGADAIRAARKYGQPFEFVNRAALFITGNARPRVDDPTVWDRALLVPFVHQVPPEDQLAESVLIGRFRQEANGILNWALQGLAAWRAEGFIVPAVIRSVTAEWQDMEDWLASFLRACCVVEPTETVAAGDVFSAYLTWLGDETDRGQPVSRNAFARALTNSLTSFRRVKRDGQTVYEGVGLKPEARVRVLDAAVAVPAAEGWNP